MTNAAHLVDAARFSPSNPGREPMGAYEANFVAAKRRLGAGWQSIANMLGRPEIDVRKAFDPEFGGTPLAGIGAVERQPVRYRPPSVLKRSLEAKAVLAMAVQPVVVIYLATIIERSYDETWACLQRLRSKGLIFKAPNARTWALTEAGKAEAELLKDRDRA